MITWPRVRIGFALIGMVTTLWMTYDLIGEGLILLGEFIDWFSITF